MLRAVCGGHFVDGKFGLEGVRAGDGRELSGDGADGDGRSFGLWKCDSDDLGIVMLGFFHNVGPDGEGDASTVGLTADSGGVVQSDPNATGEVGIESDEPGVLEIIGGAGFSSDGSFEPV